MLDSPVNEIKSKLSVEGVISGYLQLQKSGRNFKANCPFHNEKTPSFVVSPERQIWHCFGCGEGGDIFTFVMKMEGLEFRDALRLLAEKAGVKLRHVNYAKQGEKSRLYEILDVSKRFYVECLKIKKGKAAYDYLLDRGLKKETIGNFQLGYAPDSWDLLSDFLKKKGYKKEEIFAAGMTVKKDNGKNYDRFRGRIMFPINNIGGQTVGFSSRVMPGGNESRAKYINTPDTLVYNKSKVLYGLDKSRLAIKEKDSCVIVEGNMDVIMSFQAGVENVVASSGTALTWDQLQIIKRYTGNIAFAFDADSAGVKAAGRAIEMALGEDVNIGIIQIPKGKDPADCAKSDPNLWKEAAKNPKQIMDFYFASVFGKYDASKVRDKKKIAQELLNVIGKISNQIEQAHYLQILSEKLKVDEKVLSGILESVKSRKENRRNRPNGGDENDKTPDLIDREKQLQERLLGFIIVCHNFLERRFFEQEDLFSDEKLKKIYSLIGNLYSVKNEIDAKSLQNLKKSLDDQSISLQEGDNLSFIWDRAALSVESDLEEISGNVHEEAGFCATSLKKIKLQKDLKKLETDIKLAEKESDLESQKLLMKEFNECMEKLGKLEA